jgi:ribonucleoside-diphosphate reductase alpha chain
VAQPLSANKRAKEAAPEGAPVRRRLPSTRPAKTFSFTVGEADGYIIAGEYPEDGIGEIFLKVAKQGSTLSGIMDAFAISVSLGLQYGVPLEAYVQKFVNMRFEPSGMTGDPDIRFASSLVDYIFRRLALQYLPEDQRAGLGVRSIAERKADAQQDHGEDVAAPSGGNGNNDGSTGRQPTTLDVTPTEPIEPGPTVKKADAPLCYACGSKMQPAGSCYVCGSCGATSGCS